MSEDRGKGKEEEEEAVPQLQQVSYPRLLEASSDLASLIKEESKGYSLHARVRRERVLYMLQRPDSIRYACLATGQSIETIKVKLLRLLNPERVDSIEAENRDFEAMMISGLLNH